jgi:hypothetical protein
MSADVNDVLVVDIPRLRHNPSFYVEIHPLTNHTLPEKQAVSSARDQVPESASGSGPREVEIDGGRYSEEQTDCLTGGQSWWKVMGNFATGDMRSTD